MPPSSSKSRTRRPFGEYQCEIIRKIYGDIPPACIRTRGLNLLAGMGPNVAVAATKIMQRSAELGTWRPLTTSELITRPHCSNPQCEKCERYGIAVINGLRTLKSARLVLTDRRAIPTYCPAVDLVTFLHPNEEYSERR